MDQKYPRNEKLKQKREIDLLFEKGKWLSLGSLRIISLDLEKNPQEDFQLSNQKFGVSVSKKYFKKAVDRNRIKRLLRETYRLNKEIYLEHFGSQTMAMFFLDFQRKTNGFQDLGAKFSNAL